MVLTLAVLLYQICPLLCRGPSGLVVSASDQYLGSNPSWSWNFSLFVGIMDYHKPILLYLNSKEQQYVRTLKDLFGLLEPKKPSDLQSVIVY